VRQLSKNNEELKITWTCSITFPKTLKKEEASEVFDKFISLVQENKATFPPKLTFKKTKRRIVFDSENFTCAVSFGKQMEARVILNNPYENRKMANEIGSKIVNYLNTVLGEKATGARVFCTLLKVIEKGANNIPEKLLGDARIARINEVVGRALRCETIGFNFKIDEKEYMFAIFFREISSELLGSEMVYKDKLPFDLLETEIEGFHNPEKLIKELKEKEL
jgi:hypothetical protein